jgi:hypothetical protein
MLMQVTTKLEKYRIDNAAVQEIRWMGSGMRDTGNFTLMWSGSETNAVGTGCLIKRKYKEAIRILLPRFTTEPNQLHQ